MRVENRKVRMVARDGLEPPTPACSGPLSQRNNMFRIRISTQFETIKQILLCDRMGLCRMYVICIPLGIPNESGAPP